MAPTPTRLSATIFAAKVLLLRAQRGFHNLRYAVPFHGHSVQHEPFTFLAAQSTTALYTDAAPSEQWYQRGKVANLRLAAAQLDNRFLPAGETFSFWRQVGPATRRRGYQLGRMLQGGCVVPSIGGGLCQLSNALYQVALDSGCEILERHAHSRLVPGSSTTLSRDATVAWNYIDLRFRAPQDRLLRVEVTDNLLIVSLLTSTPIARPTPVAQQPLTLLPIGDDHTCDHCGQISCFRKQHVPDHDASD